ncbi:MAG: hypothetical protein KJ623_00805 [Nanoarchaeota archaeon]|nr:hypothetical protein [Nanoarchaeota archaeon]MBU0963050.1 hypothetical protein [Nanoarchaeota archaeon]
MVSKRIIGMLQREHGKKDMLSSFVLLLIGAYMYANEINYINYDIKYFSLIVLVIGALLFIRSLASH